MEEKLPFLQFGWLHKTQEESIAVECIWSSDILSIFELRIRRSPCF